MLFQKYNGPGNAVVRDDNRYNDYGGSVGGPSFFATQLLRSFL